MNHIQYKNAAINTIYDEFVEFGARSAFSFFDMICKHTKPRVHETFLAAQ